MHVSPGGRPPAEVVCAELQLNHGNHFRLRAVRDKYLMSVGGAAWQGPTIGQQMTRQILERHKTAPSDIAFVARAFLPSPWLAEGGAIPHIVEKREGLRMQSDHLAKFRLARGLFKGAGTPAIYFGFEGPNR